MDQEIKIEPEKRLLREDIPENIYNRKLSDETRERLASGRQSMLIKDIITEEGKSPRDAKLTALKDEEGKTVIQFDYAEKNLILPKKIFGIKLNDKDLDRLFHGELISLKYKGNQYHVGVDKDLNKITVKSNHQLGIPKSINGYTLTDMDKSNIANGKATDLHLFKTKEGDIYTAKLNMTPDKNGVVFENIQLVQPENEKELSFKFNRESLEQTTNGKHPLIIKDYQEKFNSLDPKIREVLLEESRFDFRFQPKYNVLLPMDTKGKDKQIAFAMKNFSDYEGYLKQYADHNKIKFDPPIGGGQTAVQLEVNKSSSPVDKLNSLHPSVKLELLTVSSKDFKEEVVKTFDSEEKKLYAHSEFIVKNYSRYEKDVEKFSEKYILGIDAKQPFKNFDDKESISKNIVPSHLQENGGSKDPNVIFIHGDRKFQNSSEDRAKTGTRKAENFSIIEYEKIHELKSGNGISIQATGYWAPKTLKGVELTDEQRKSITEGKATLVKDMQFKTGLTTAYVTLNKEANGGKGGFEFDYELEKNKKIIGKQLSKEKASDLTRDR